jgi:nucleoid-associated protein YgaU
VPPLTVGGTTTTPRPIPSQPQVESFDEEEYRVRSGDTIQSICQRFYQTERYAQALLLFNRNHPLASPGVRQEPPVLQPGQPVFIPPTSILEKRYGTSVPNLTPLPPAGARRTERPSYSPPEAGASSLAQYQVPGDGEMMWELAKRLLGSGERWREIHHLNPGLRPELRVPGGTALRLPPDARVEAAVRP